MLLSRNLGSMNDISAQGCIPFCTESVFTIHYRPVVINVAFQEFRKHE